MDDSNIVDLFLARDESAISHTENKYGTKLRDIANRVLNDYALAEECENDTYLTAWNQIPPNEPRTYLFAFLAKIIRCLATDELRKRNSAKRSAVFCELTSEMEECISSESSSVEDALDAKELGGLIASFLRRYSQEQQNIFVRRYWYFDSIQEINELYGFSKGKVTVTLSRMRKELRSYLMKEGYLV